MDWFIRLLSCCRRACQPFQDAAECVSHRGKRTRAVVDKRHWEPRVAGELARHDPGERLMHHGKAVDDGNARALLYERAGGLAVSNLDRHHAWHPRCAEGV